MGKRLIEKRLMVFITVVLVMASLSGCAKKAGNSNPDEVKTKAEQLKEQKEIVTAINDKHNQYNAYRISKEKENVIQQLDLEGNSIGTFEITEEQKGISIQNIASVTNEEIMYLLDKEDKFELWTIPLKQKKNKDVVQTEKKRFLFSTKDNIDIVYANANYIAYKENLNYTEFDRKQQKNILANASDKKCSYCQPDNFQIQTTWLENRNDDGMVFLAKNVGEDQYPQNIYIHKVGSGKVNKIADTYLAKNHTIDIAYSNDKIYYTGLIKSWKKEKSSWNIWCYDCKTKRNDSLVQEKDIKDTGSFSKIDALFINKDELWMETENEKQKFLYCSITSDNSSFDPPVTNAAKLNQYLASLKKKNQYISVVTIENNQCIIKADHATGCRFYCYDIKKDKERWRFCK